MMVTHVLVVDDHQLYRETFCALLQDCFPHIAISAAADGSAALTLTQQIPFTLLVLDYQLPTINGGDVIRHLRARSRATGCFMPLAVLMSSQPDVTCFVRMLGASGFLPKPSTAEQVTATLGPLLAQASQPAEPAKPKLWRIRPRLA
jgi:two-component system sensor histidine kinase/response regulator